MPKLNTYFLVNSLLIPLLIATFFTAIYFYHSLYKHLSYDSSAFDLGIYTQISYLYSHNLPIFSTLKGTNLLADHFGPILMILSPIYRIFPSAITLLFVQALFVGISGIFIYLVAFDKLKSPLTATLITLSYLSSGGIIAATNFDFHLATISVLPLSLLIYSWYFKKIKLYWFALIFSFLFKEDIPVFTFGLGLYQLLIGERKIGIITTTISAVSFYLIKFQIMPFLWNPGVSGSYINTSFLPITQPLELTILLITNPRIFLDHLFNSPLKSQTIDVLLRPFAFLSALSPLTYLAVLPNLYFRFSSTYQASWTNSFHHNANLMPFLAFSSILVIDKYKIPKKPLTLLLVFLLITSSFSPNGPVFTDLQRHIEDANVYAYIESSITDIPQNLSVAAQSPIVPHIANRETVYLFPEFPQADIIILDITLNTYPMDLNELKMKIAALRKSPYYQVYRENKGLIIFKRNATVGL